MVMVDAIEQLFDQKIPLNVKNPEVLQQEGFSFSSQDQIDKMQRLDVSGLQITLQHYALEILEIINVCKKMVKKEYVIGSAGNVSMRVQLPDGKQAFLFTPSSVEYDYLQIEDIVLTNAEGESILGKRNPTSERRLHLAIYRARLDIKAIVHSHAPYSTTLSIARIPIGPIVDEIIPFIGGCDVAEFGMAGSDELAYNAVQALGNNLAVFIANHGNVCCGNTIDQAWIVCQQVEMAAKIQYRAALLGPIYALPEEAEKLEKEIFDIMREIGG
jgi:L-fuculose-phosphate aldolase